MKENEFESATGTDIAEIETPAQLCRYLKLLYGFTVDTDEVKDEDGVLWLFIRVKLRGFKLIKYLIFKNYRYVIGTGVLYTCRSINMLSDKDQVKLKLRFEV